MWIQGTWGLTSYQDLESFPHDWQAPYILPHDNTVMGIVVVGRVGGWWGSWEERVSCTPHTSPSSLLPLTSPHAGGGSQDIWGNIFCHHRQPRVEEDHLPN